MYIPATNAMNNRDETVGFMQRFSLVTIISTKDSVPTATPQSLGSRRVTTIQYHTRCSEYSSDTPN
ncbi:hypothetical protein [Persicitalea sp.]|uniref:hypothetical protein n=1 Tax=Persicitalea sp. TaxID=3100273 RepID=UPI003593528B